jgi:YesN/AraC family two-component response regulator
MHWTTLEKILKYPSPPGYCRTKPPKKSKIGPYLERIRQIIEQDKQMPKKQRHTAKRIWQVLQKDGHVQAFQFFGGVAKRITYDNSRIAASKIIGPRQRELITLLPWSTPITM